MFLWIPVFSGLVLTRMLTEFFLFLGCNLLF